MKIYLAASYTRRIEMCAYRDALEEDGHIITSEWITGIHEQTPWTEATYSQHDLQCIREADVFIGFTEEEDVPIIKKRGGRHVEFGYAFAHRKIIFIVGPRENAFYYLHSVFRFDTFKAARDNLNQMFDNTKSR